MTVQLWVPQPSIAPSPADAAAYLLQQGWTLESASASWAVYLKRFDGFDGQPVKLEVPQQAAAPDYGRAFGHLIDDLARLEQRAPSSLLRDISASSVDVVRLAIEGSSTRDGRIPVEAGRRVYEAARDLLLAAACSVIDPRPVFVKRKPEDAMSLLGRARFGLAEVGSFVLTMECSIPPRLRHAAEGDDGDPDAPLERKACVRLARALQAAEWATRQSGASGKIDPFRERTRDGVSANLCDGIAEILDATSADTLRAAFSFAPRRPLLAEVPRAIAFSSDTSGILREAAKRMREDASYPATEVFGTVVKLDSPNSAIGGEVVLRVEVPDGRLRRVRVVLDATPYQVAIEAHGARTLVRCVGDLAREGGSWVLRNPRDFAAAEQDE